MKLVKEIIDKKEIYLEEIVEKDDYGNLIKTFKPQTRITLKNGEIYNFDIDIPQMENQEIDFVSNYENNKNSLLTNEFKKDFIKKYEKMPTMKEIILFYGCPFLVVSILSMIFGLILHNFALSVTIPLASITASIFLLNFIKNEEKNMEQYKEEIKKILSLIKENNSEKITVKEKSEVIVS